MIYDFCRYVTDIVHPSNPFHLILCFELFGYALTLSHLFYQPKKHFLSLPVDFGKMSVQFPACQQVIIQNFVIPLQIPCVPLSPYSDRLFFFGR